MQTRQPFRFKAANHSVLAEATHSDPIKASDSSSKPPLREVDEVASRHFLLLRPALIDVVPLITSSSAPVTRRSNMASATVGLLLPR